MWLPVIICTAALALFVWGVRHFAEWGVGTFGIGFGLVGIALTLLIARAVDLRRSRADRDWQAVRQARPQWFDRAPPP